MIFTHTTTTTTALALRELGVCILVVVVIIVGGRESHISCSGLAVRAAIAALAIIGATAERASNGNSGLVVAVLTLFPVVVVCVQWRYLAIGRTLGIVGCGVYRRAKGEREQTRQGVSGWLGGESESGRLGERTITELCWRHANARYFLCHSP